MKYIINVAIILTLLVNGLQATLTKGDELPEINVRDQHEQPHSLTPRTRYLLVSFDMSTGKAANKFLSEKGQAFLDENKAAFLSNIYGMPWIGRKFALPKMKKYPHQILLADEEGLLDEFPEKKGMVTVFELNESLGIVGIHFWDPRKGNNPFQR